MLLLYHAHTEPRRAVFYAILCLFFSFLPSQKLIMQELYSLLIILGLVVECNPKENLLRSVAILGLADLRYESSLVGFLKPRPKLTFGYDAQLAFIP